MTPDDEQIVRKTYQMTRHGAPRSPPHRCRPQAPPRHGPPSPRATSYLRSALTC